MENYAKYILFRVDKKKSLEYFKLLNDKYSIKYYKKQMHSIKKFLSHLGVDWVDEIQLPRNPTYRPQRYTWEDIQETLCYFKDHPHHLQIKALILLGATSGMRAEELYQLLPQDIDLQNKTIHINHNPKEGQTTKTQHSRISFFTSQTQQALSDYLEHYETLGYSRLFPQTTLTRYFNGAPLRVKHLRKVFSQQWDRHGGPTTIKKILMGHSLNGDVDLQHYNAQSEEDLKNIYQQVMDDESES